MKTNHAVIGFILFVSLAALAKPPVKPQGSSQSSDRLEEFRTKMELEKTQIKILNKATECVGDGECDYLPAGENRCGGPSGYVVFSANNPNLSSLKARAEAYTSAEKSFNTLTTDAVDCTTPKIPDPKCQKQKCIDASGARSIFSN